MPAENLEEQGLEKNPNLQLSQWRFLLKTELPSNTKQLVNDIIAEIKTHSEYFTGFMSLPFNNDASWFNIPL